MSSRLIRNFSSASTRDSFMDTEDAPQPKKHIFNDNILTNDGRFDESKELPTQTFKQVHMKDVPKLPLADRVESFPDLYTNSTKVSDHTEQDLGKYYNFSDLVRKKFPPEIGTPKLDEEFDVTGNYMMIRKNAFDLVQQMKKVEDKSVTGTVLAVMGHSGRGKTAALHYAAQYALEKDWLFLAFRAHDLYYDVPGFIQPHPTRELLWDQPFGTKKMFRRLRDQQTSTLMKIKLKKAYPDYNWKPKLKGKDAQTADALKPVVGSDGVGTLFDLVALGALDETQTPSLLWDFIDEVQNVTECPILVTIDDYNRFDNLSDFVRPDNAHHKIKNNQLSLVDAICSLARDKVPKNGITMFSPTQGSTLRNMGKHLSYSSETRIERCDVTEVDNAISHYKVSNNIFTPWSDVNDKNYRAKFRIMSQGIFSEMSFLSGLM